jgi:TRAP-type C4-dicarboxylate transport system substrate-binding protein
MFFFARLLRVIVTSLVTAIAASPYSGGVSAQALPPTTLKVVGSWDFLAQYRDFELPFWQKTIPQLTNGAVKAEVTAFNTMGLKGTEIVRLMKLGMIDFGTTVLAYGAEADIETEGIDLAGLNDTVERARAVAAAYLPVLDEFFQKKHGIKVLAIWPYPAQVIYCKTEIKDLADLKGRKIRVGTRPVAEFVEAMGGVALNIPFGDAHAALKAGAAHCGVTGALPGNSAKWYEVTQFIYPLPLGWSMSMQAVTLATWNGLDARVKAVLSAEISTLSTAIWARADLETNDGLNCNTGQGTCTLGTRAGMTLTRISDTDRDLLQQILRSVVVKRWAQRCSAACVDQWNATVGKVVNIRAEP